MGPLQRVPGTAPAALSQDPPWLRRRERISLVKNRMREICTSGSVRGGGGDVPTYSAVDLSQRVDVGGEAGGSGQRGERAGEAELTIGKGGAQHLQEQVAEAAGEHADGQEEAGWTSDPARLIGRDPPARHQAMQVWMVCHR